ncbi:MAG: hypothetical protein KC560_19425, partial [Myxococcales bacterium]|nr:hypothetical protein [Myxococcales bacterium]
SGAEARASAGVARSTAAVVWLDVGSARERAVDVAAWLEREHGVDLGGLHLLRATAISDDGRAIAGDAVAPDGRREAWLARIGR